MNFHAARALGYAFAPFGIGMLVSLGINAWLVSDMIARVEKTNAMKPGLPGPASARPDSAGRRLLLARQLSSSPF